MKTVVLSLIAMTNVNRRKFETVNISRQLGGDKFGCDWLTLSGYLSSAFLERVTIYFTTPIH